MDKEENLNNEEPLEDEYLRVPMFEEFDDGDEFSPLVNDLFGVMS